VSYPDTTGFWQDPSNPNTVSVADPTNAARVASGVVGEVTENKNIVLVLPSQFAGSTIIPTITGSKPGSQLTPGSSAGVPVLSSGSVVVSQSSAVVSWLSDGAGLSAGFELQLSEDGVVWGSVRTSASASSTFSGLTAGKDYWVRVRAVTEVGPSSYLTLKFKTASLDSPRNLMVVDRGVGSVSLGWDKPVQGSELLVDYQVMYSLDGLEWSVFADGVSTKTSAIVTGLETGKTYQFKVQGVAPAPASDTEGRVSAGGGHVCAVVGSTVSCWGSNSLGQLGDGTTVSKSSPVSVNLDNVTQVGSGGAHSCAIVGSGEIYCWGNNSNGQVGDGTTQNRLLPTKVSGITNAVQISLGHSHSCAVLADKTVKCWGFNGDGRLGDGTAQNRSLPVTVVGVSDAKVVRAGYYHTCMLTNSGSVKCWGSNVAGQTGGNTLGSLGTAVDVATQGDFTCALLADGTVWCWGWNYANQIVNGGGMVIGSPTKINWGVPFAKKIDTGNDHLCIIDNLDRALCVGWNGMGQLGDGGFADRTFPALVSGLSNVSNLYLGGAGWGWDFSCAETAEGKLYCWGGNDSGQIGTSQGEIHPVPNFVMQLPSSNSVNSEPALTSGSSAGVPVLSSGSVVVSQSSAVVSWLSDGAGLSAGFELQLSEDGVVWGSVRTSASASSTFSGLTAGKDYWVRVRAVTEAGTSSYLTLKFKTASLDSPRNLRVVDRGVGSVSLAWDKPVHGSELLVDYQVLYSLDGLEWTVFADGVSTKTSATVTGLETGKSYQFKVQPVTGEAPTVVAVDHGILVNPGVWGSGVEVSYQWYLDGVAISGATANIYRPVGADVGKTLSVVVSGTVNGASLNLRSVSAGVIAPTALTLTSKPSVQGILAAGELVTANPGVWDEGVVFSYQWFRDGVALSGVQGSTYRLTGLDTSRKITVAVTGSKQGYVDKVLTSDAVTIGIGTQVWVQGPVLVGEARVASALKVQTSNEYPASFKYQWFRNGKAVVGAISDSYALTSKDLGATLSVTTRSVVAGFKDATFTSAVVVTAGLLKSVTAPSISGTSKVGGVLLGNVGVWPTGVRTTVQWLRDGNPIASANRNSYLLSAADSGKQISFRVTASLKGFENAVAIADLPAVALGDLVSSTPIISGRALFGRTLRAGGGFWTNGTALSYQWLANGEVIGNANKTTLYLDDSLVGKTIQVKVTGRKDGYLTQERLSAASEVVTGGRFTVGTVSVNDVNLTGSTVTVNPGTWGEGVTLTYQWFRGTALISDQTGPSMLLTPADIGFKISVVVTGTKANYVTVVSKAVTTRTVKFGR
jgi:alpha-tubulin suppressor-like RCC1 family protein